MVEKAKRDAVSESESAELLNPFICRVEPSYIINGGNIIWNVLFCQVKILVLSQKSQRVCFQVKNIWAWSMTPHDVFFSYFNAYFQVRFKKGQELPTGIELPALFKMVLAVLILIQARLSHLFVRFLRLRTPTSKTTSINRQLDRLAHSNEFIIS